MALKDLIADHAAGTGSGCGSIGAMGRCCSRWDDGRGLPAGFSLQQRAGLGLSIVRGLVESEPVGRWPWMAGVAREPWFRVPLAR